MIQCRRLGYAVMTTGRIDALAAYYEDVIGLYPSHRERDRAVFATRQGLECLVLERGEGAGACGAVVRDLAAHAAGGSAGRAGEGGRDLRIRAGRTPGVPRVLAFTDCKGTEVELFNAAGFVATDARERGVNALKLGHVAHFMPSIEEATAFYVDLLGFRQSDWREGRSMFLRCSPDHHTVNFFKGEARLAHLAFEVKDFPELVRASDLLVRNGFPLDWGPARHTIGHNCACYHRNPDGIRTELYAEMDRMLDEELGYFDPKPWHEDRPQRPRNWEYEDSPRNKWIPGVP